MRLDLTLAAAVLALSAGAARADIPPEPPNPDCIIHLSDVRHPLRFKDYPARPWRAAGYPKPVLDTAEKRAYRTRIREAAAEGPNFAGRFKVALWGAGTGNIDVAFIDESTGQVVFDDSLSGIWGGRVADADAPGADYRVMFRPDSRLLIALGAPHEDESREGVHFFEWTGRRLKLLRFVPRLQACHVEPE